MVDCDEDSSSTLELLLRSGSSATDIQYRHELRVSAPAVPKAGRLTVSRWLRLELLAVEMNSQISTARSFDNNSGVRHNAPVAVV